MIIYKGENTMNREEIKKELEKNGVVLSDAELDAMIAEYNSGELSEANLETVAGGYVRPGNPLVDWILEKLGLKGNNRRRW